MVLRILWNTAAGLLERQINRNLTKKQMLQPWLWRGRSGLLDCDVNLHFSNSSYFYAMDLCRWRHAATQGFLHYAIKHRFMFVLASQGIRLRYPIAPFQPYEIHSQICYWDDEWVYFLHRFRHPTTGKLYAEGIGRLGLVGTKGRTSPHEALQDLNIPGYERPKQMPELVKGLLAYDQEARKSMEHEQTRRWNELAEEQHQEAKKQQQSHAKKSQHQSLGLLRFFTASVNWPLN